MLCNTCPVHSCFQTAMHDPLCTACLHLSVWTSLAGAAVFRSGSACSPWLMLLLPDLAAGRTAGAVALLCPAWSVASKLLANPPIAMRLKWRLYMVASFLEDSAQSLAAIQAQGFAGGVPKEDVLRRLIGVLQQLLSCCQCLCCPPTTLKHFLFWNCCYCCV